LNCTYDFGDGWEHSIKVERMLPGVLVDTLPMCVGGGGATPPEDCGGVPGYQELVQIMADPERQLSVGGFKGSMQHTMTRPGGWSVADEAATPDLLLGGPEGPDVGAVEGRMDDAPDRPPV